MNNLKDHTAAALKAIYQRLHLVDLVLDVRDARIPLTSTNAYLQDIFSRKRHVVVLNKMDLANPDDQDKWKKHFEDRNESCCFVNAHNKLVMEKLLNHLRSQLHEITFRKREATIMVVGIPNVGKSALINALHQIGRARFPEQEKLRRAAIGPLPCVTQDITGFKIGHCPSEFILDTPGILPRVQEEDKDLTLKLVLTGALMDNKIKEVSLAKYLLSMLNYFSAPLQWKHLDIDGVEDVPVLSPNDDISMLSKNELKRQKKQSQYITDHTQDNIVLAVRKALFKTFVKFKGNIERANEVEGLINAQFDALHGALRVPGFSDEAATVVAKKLLNLYRTGRLGRYTLDSIPQVSS